jgi:hypothetical protein
MNNAVKRLLCDKKGGSYIDIIIGCMVAVLFLALVSQVMPVIIYKNQLGSFATNVSRIVSVEGCYSQDVINEIQEYKERIGIGEVNISLEGTQFISGTQKIQLNGIIEVTLSSNYELGIGNFGSFPVTLTNKAQARSEIYWKD